MPQKQELQDTKEQIGSVHVKSADIEASVGGQIEVTKEDYEPLEGTRVIIPANALAEAACARKSLRMRSRERTVTELQLRLCVQVSFRKVLWLHCVTSR